MVTASPWAACPDASCTHLPRRSVGVTDLAGPFFRAAQLLSRQTIRGEARPTSPSPLVAGHMLMSGSSRWTTTFRLPRDDRAACRLPPSGCCARRRCGESPLSSRGLSRAFRASVPTGAVLPRQRLLRAVGPECAGHPRRTSPRRLEAARDGKGPTPVRSSSDKRTRGDPAETQISRRDHPVATG